MAGSNLGEKEATRRNKHQRLACKRGFQREGGLGGEMHWGEEEVRPPGSQRGSALLEFALVLPFFLAFAFATFDLCFWVFTKATLHHAVHAGVRFAITGQTQPGLGHDASIKQVVKKNALGLLSTAADEQKIKIRYFAVDGSGQTTANAPGNIVEVSVENYQLTPLITEMVALPASINVTVSAVDKLEPFPIAPPR